MITDNSSTLTVAVDAREPYDADDAYLAGWIRGFAVAEALAHGEGVQEPYEPVIVEPAVKSES